jgi:hypothetical protein
MWSSPHQKRQKGQWKRHHRSKDSPPVWYYNPERERRVGSNPPVAAKRQVSDMGARKYATGTRGKPFERGNPGRRPGSRNRATLAAEALLDREATAISRKAVELALNGDTTAIRLVLDRILPPRRERPIRFDLPLLKEPADAVSALAAITVGVSSGELTAGEAQQLAQVVDIFVRALEAGALEERLRALEAAQ